jgi:nucleoside-diphosphate-sugar epimerase
MDVLMFDRQTDLSRLAMIRGTDTDTRLRVVQGEIQDTDTVKRLMKDEEITHVVHLAAVLMPFCQASPVTGALINVVGTLNLFEGARDCGRDVRMVYASSSAVWGPGDVYGDRALTESDIPLPATHYGVYKHANEGNARVFFASNGISSIGLRPWTVYGVGRDAGLTADPTLAMRAVAKGEPFQIRLTGNMDLQYVEDVAETFIRCLLSPVTGAHVFNLAGDIIDMHDLIRMLDAVRPGASELITAAGPSVPVAYRMDDSALRVTVGEMPRTPLQRGIDQTLQMFGSLRAAGRLG